MLAGRPSLTERRREATRTEVARAAARLFAEHGYDTTTVEEIAATAGMALRTFYRYFPSKEDTVAPLLAAGIDEWVRRLDGCEPELALLPAMQQAFREALHEGGLRGDLDEDALRALLRTVDGHPALRSVWLRVHRDCERKLLPVIAGRAGKPAEATEMVLAAGIANTAVRIAMERWATGATGPADPAEHVAACLEQVAGGGLLR